MKRNVKSCKLMHEQEEYLNRADTRRFNLFIQKYWINFNHFRRLSRNSHGNSGITDCIPVSIATVLGNAYDVAFITLHSTQLCYIV